MEEGECCPSCGELLAVPTKCVKCGWPSLLNEPDMEQIEGSEIAACVDVVDGVGADNVCRPVLISQEDGDMLCLTLSDSKRLLKFLREAVPYLEEQNGVMPQ